jgi:hypothetical protein
MQTVKLQSGQDAPIEVHVTYRILVLPVRPENLDTPADTP